MNNQCKFTVLLILAMVLTFAACSGAGTDPITMYTIGDTGPSGVGIVFYITDGGLHGLEAAPSLWENVTEDPVAQWKTSGTTTAGTSAAIGTGYANTYTYLTGSEHPAAALCRAYSGGGLSDWFLPSQNELDALYWWQDTNGGSFVEDSYWSSTEAGETLARYQGFINGNQGSATKTGSLYVRAVRAF
ncbi:MAG: DUF1566 domain-containing protein [Spirochaetales bacterium]|nr:DUF1566 domain-containing protein [Spirochaetales bacterium]